MPLRTILGTALVSATVSAAVVLAAVLLVLPRVGLPLLRVQHLELVNARGDLQGQWGVLPTRGSGPAEATELQLLDAQGAPRVVVAATAGGGRLRLSDGQNHRRVELSAVTWPDGADLENGLVVSDSTASVRILVGDPVVTINARNDYGVYVLDESSRTIGQVP